MNSLALLIVSIMILGLIYLVFQAKLDAQDRSKLLQSVVYTIVFVGLVVLGIVWIINMMIMVPELLLLPRT